MQAAIGWVGDCEAFLVGGALWLLPVVLSHDLEMTNSIKPRERLLETANRAFYSFGYRGVGVDQLIRDSGIAKATFYNHFESKDELFLETLRQASSDTLDEIQGYLAARDDPFEKVMGPVDFVTDWLRARGFRGCTFINAASEIESGQDDQRSVGMSYYSRLRDLIASCGQELADSDPAKFGHAADEEFATNYLLILAGGIALSTIYKDEAPMRKARAAIASALLKS